MSANSGNVVALERLLARRRRLSAIALSLDGYLRWGQGTDPGFEREGRAAVAEQNLVTAELAALVASLRRSDPAAVTEWAQAHLRLIDAFLADADADAGAGPSRSTVIHVAREQRGGWQAVRDGTQDFVAENTYYDHHDPTRYRAEFGFDP